MKSLLYVTPLSGTNRVSIARRFDLPDLLLPFWGYRKKMPVHRIVRLEGEGNYTLFHFDDGSQLMVSLTLKKLEGRLSPRLFVRPHKKNIINLLYVATIHPDRQHLTVSLTNGDCIDVSRRKASSFIKQLQEFEQEVRLLAEQPVALSA